MTSPYADLRARLAPLAAAARNRSTITDLIGVAERYIDVYPDIDALLARGEAAEADAETLRETIESQELQLDGLRVGAASTFARGEAAEADAGKWRQKWEELASAGERHMWREHGEVPS